MPFSPLGTSVTPGSPGAGSETGEGNTRSVFTFSEIWAKETPVATVINKYVSKGNCGKL